jgi:glycerate kinase
MADLTNGSGVFATYNNSGSGVSELGDNYGNYVINQADVGRELIVKVARSTGNGGVTKAVLDAVIAYITTAHGVSGSGDSAFTVAAVGTATGIAYVNSTATEAVFLRVQGTGDLTVADADTGIANVAVTIEAIFTPAK